MALPTRAISQDVLKVLAAGRTDHNLFLLPDIQLDRKLYTETDKVLAALGGKWNRGKRAHLFGEACADLIDGAIDTGSYVKPDNMGWFPTPSPLAERVVETACIAAGQAVLEPSGGEGAIVLAAQARGAVVTAIELDARRSASLRRLLGDDRVICADFLQVSPEPTYDAVVMNPPFAKRADIRHVLHASRFLKAGARLVSIMAGGVVFREDKLTRDFRARAASIEPLPPGSFHGSGTDVNTVLVTLIG